MSGYESSRTTDNRSGSRYYHWRGDKFWSVTTIIGGGLPSPALINWAKKFTAEYAVDHLDQLIALCAKNEEGEWDRRGAVDWLKDASYRYRDKKGDIGSACHDAIEAYVLGRPYPPWAEIIRQRMEAFVGFLEMYKPEFVEGATEAPVFNRKEKYAGTNDAICRIGGRLGNIDYKSGGKGIYPKVALQLSAYRHAEFIGAPDGSEVEMPALDFSAALHLPENGTFELVEVDTGPEIFRAFKFVREVFRWEREMSKHVILGTFPVTGPVA